MISIKQILEELESEIDEAEVGEVTQAPVIQNQTSGQPNQTVPTTVPIDLSAKKKLTSEEKKQLLSLVSGFNEHRNVLNVADQFKSMAENIMYISELTEKYALNETSEWFEGVTLERDMKELKKSALELQKISNKIHPQVKLAHHLFEEIGLKLQRYYDV